MGGYKLQLPVVTILVALTPHHKPHHKMTADAAGIGIPASCISVWYRSIPIPDWVYLSRYRTDSGIGIFGYSGTVFRCRTVRHSGIDEKVHPARRHTAN
jgi:hypothetical protein